MKINQERIVKILPKIIVLVIAFYNFTWASWQNLNHVSACVICPWYVTGEFLYPQFFLFLTTVLLFIPRIWSYLISVLVSGYFAVSWMWLVVSWFWITDYSLSYRMEIITSSYFGHPLQIWEIQVVIATSIFAFSVYYFVKESFLLKLNRVNKLS